VPLESVDGRRHNGGGPRELPTYSLLTKYICIVMDEHMQIRSIVSVLLANVWNRVNILGSMARGTENAILTALAINVGLFSRVELSISYRDMHREKLASAKKKFGKTRV
jgi:hypothetical protein